MINFPLADEADEDGIVLVGGQVNAQNLISAYRKGIFPWPVHPEPYPILWFSPDPRGVLFLENFHQSRSLKKFIRKSDFTITMNQNFQEIINLCKKAKRKDSGTWITQEVINGYVELHQLGKAYSIEVRKDGDIVGGLYGVCIDDFYSAESMFFIEPQASKMAVTFLIELLNKKQVKWLDIQMVTPVTQSFGGEELPRKEFLKLLDACFY